MKSKIGIVIPCLNYFKGFTELVETIKSKHEYKIYVQPQHRQQVPLSAAWNKGFNDAVNDGCTHIAILNDDILLSPDCLDNMAYCLDKIKDVVLVSANNLNGHMPPLDIMTHQEVPYADSSYSEHPNYSCFMVKADFFDKVGSFDENFAPAWFEDNDSHRRIMLLGYKAICTTYASCIHYGSITSSMLPPDRRDNTASKSYYIRKWGGMPYSHPVDDSLKERFTHPFDNPDLSPKDWSLQA